MVTTEPCNICGCTESHLFDGFYYCTECGTQDTNVRETILEYVAGADGGTQFCSRRRITKIPKAKDYEMTDDWYKWHGLNFLLNGLADELIEQGAAPSFKTKLLWVWTRYMKKYQNKADFGLAANESDDNEEDEEMSAENEDEYASDEEKETRGKANKTALLNDIKKISMPLIISFLYVALNLDKSPIQLTNMMRFMREGRVSIINWHRLVPAELRPKRLRRVLLIDRVWFKYSLHQVRILGLELFRKLDLGNPIVPDLRPLVERYLKELWLPNDLKPLVFSLMHYRSFDYLDINTKYKELRYIPSYELYVMSHILLAMKICFGLDCEYEVKLSDAVEKINNAEDHPKSYNSEPTKRLFNFRDWCSYIQFRKTLVRTHTLYLGEPNYFDMNDYVAFEHQRERPDYNINLKDEIALDIIKKIPNGELNVIPKSEFAATLTPHVSYTQTILEHLQDPIVKQSISEDFTQYSLDYILKDMFLIDFDSTNPKNIIAGVSESNKQQSNTGFEFVNRAVRFGKGMVYVKDCDNHNWMVTQRPTLEHITTSEKVSESDEKENDHGYVSNPETLLNVIMSNNINLDETQKSAVEARDNSPIALNDDKTIINDLSSIADLRMETDEKECRDDALVADSSSKNMNSKTDLLGNVGKDIKPLTIREEDAGRNIFDDDFIQLETKKEEGTHPDEMELDERDPEYYNVNEASASENIHEIFKSNQEDEQYPRVDKESDDSSVNTIHLNPESLDRKEAIKELLIHACNKYLMSIPGSYRFRKPRRLLRKQKKVVRAKYFKGETAQNRDNLISAYHTHLEQDILHQMSNMVHAAIADFNPSKESQELADSGDLPGVDDEMDTANNQTIENEPANTNDDETAAVDSKYNLFNDSSDGETHAADLLPKKNPEFDEETHDIRQLYIEPSENTDIPEIQLNPKLIEIINQTIEGKPPKADDEVTSDSEEDVCVSVLQEQKRIRQQLTKQQERTKARRLRPLIPSRVPPYKLWVRHYFTSLTCTKSNQRFTNDLDEKLPKSFVFVIKECADVVGYPPFYVYKGLQRVEECIKDKYACKRKCRVPSYLFKNNRSNKVRKHMEF